MKKEYLQSIKDFAIRALISVSAGVTCAALISLVLHIAGLTLSIQLGADKECRSCYEEGIRDAVEFMDSAVFVEGDPETTYKQIESMRNGTYKWPVK